MARLEQQVERDRQHYGLQLEEAIQERDHLQRADEDLRSDNYNLRAALERLA